jgi:hypothetical protein
MSERSSTEEAAEVLKREADEAEHTEEVNRRYRTLLAFLGGDMKNTVPLLATQRMKVADHDANGRVSLDAMIETIVIRTQPPWWSITPARVKERSIYDAFVARLIEEIAVARIHKKSELAKALAKGQIGRIRLEVFEYYAKGKSEMKAHEATL